MEYRINSLSDIAIQYIKDQILSARLKSGAKITEADIAKTLQISRAPVREALRTLSQNGLVTYSPRRGHFILEMQREELFEVFQIRMALELHILKILTANQLLREEDFRYLEHLSREMSRNDLRDHGDHDRIFQLNLLDLDFHRYLWKRSNSDRRAGLLEDFFMQLLIAMNINTVTLGTGEEKAQEHARLIKALRTNDVNLVREEFQMHLEKYVDATLGDLTENEKRNLQVVMSD